MDSNRLQTLILDKVRLWPRTSGMLKSAFFVVNVTEDQIDRALESLKSQGLIQKHENGRWQEAPQSH